MTPLGRRSRSNPVRCRYPVDEVVAAARCEIVVAVPSEQVVPRSPVQGVVPSCPSIHVAPPSPDGRRRPAAQEAVVALSAFVKSWPSPP